MLPARSVSDYFIYYKKQKLPFLILIKSDSYDFSLNKLINYIYINNN